MTTQTVKRTPVAPSLSPEPNIMHIRLENEDGELLARGGVTVAYLLSYTEGALVAHCGVSVCSEEDVFNKRTGVARAKWRLVGHLRNSSLDHTRLSTSFEVVHDVELADKVKRLGESDFVMIKADDFDVNPSLIENVTKFVIEYRMKSYEGSNEDIIESIDSMFDSDSYDEDGEGDEEDDLEIDWAAGDAQVSEDEDDEGDGDEDVSDLTLDDISSPSDSDFGEDEDEDAIPKDEVKKDEGH